MSSFGVADLRGLLGIEYTEEQLNAITAPLRPGVIVAGAGSGKTTVMAARVVWLVARGEVTADGVLGLTFTNKAAAELADRVRTALEKAGLLGPSAQELMSAHQMTAQSDDVPGEPTISTYHAYADRLVKEHGLRIGVEPSAQLLADASRFQLAARAVRAARGPLRHLSGDVATLAEAVIDLDAELSEHLVEVEAARTFDERLVAVGERYRDPRTGRPKRSFADCVKAADVAAARVELLALVEDYRALKRDRELLDFGDQMALGARLAEQRPEVGRIEREKYSVVLLDEYQDTSVAQRRMLSGLFGLQAGDGVGHPVTAVGDPCQSIYGWRGASVANLDDFPRHFPVKERDRLVAAERYTLTENRRSGGRLLSFANELAGPLRERHAGLAPLRPAAAKAAGGWTTCALLPTQAEEVSWLGDQVVAHHYEHDVAWSEIAVLVRTNAQIAPLYAELHARGVPVEVVGLSGLLDLPEVADLVATLDVIDEPIANASLVRLLTGPRWRIGPRDLALLGRRARQLVADEVVTGEGLDSLRAHVDPTEIVSLSDAMADPGEELPFSAAARSRFASFAAEIATLRRSLGDPLSDVLHKIMAACGLDVEVAASPQVREARCAETVDAFLGFAAGWAAGPAAVEGDGSVTAFRAYLRAAARHERGLDVDLPSAGDSVKLLTMHKSKGLEWDVVCVPHLVGGPSRSASRWTASHAVLPFPLRGDAEHLPALGEEYTRADFAEFGEACREREATEALRLAYVTFTRPRARIVASGHWWGPTQRTRRGPDAYLLALREHCLAGNGTVDVWTSEDEAGEANPALGVSEVRWPVPLEEEALRRRRRAAELVEESLRLHQTADGVARSSPRDQVMGAAERRQVESWDRDLEALLVELRMARRARREIDMPASMSATDLIRLLDDADRFTRELARPMPRQPAPRARLGTRFHEWVESLFDQQPLLEPDDLPGAADEEVVDDADLEALKQAFLRTSYADRRPLRIEQPFQLRLAGTVVRGRIDAVYELDGADGARYEVVDWKTSRQPDANRSQLAVYRLAWAELAGVPLESVTATFLYVRTGHVDQPAGLPDRADLERELAERQAPGIAR